MKHFKKDHVHGESSSLGLIKMLLVQTTLGARTGLPI